VTATSAQAQLEAYNREFANIALDKRGADNLREFVATATAAVTEMQAEAISAVKVRALQDAIRRAQALLDEMVYTEPHFDPPTSADLGRVYLHGTTVRVVLIAINPADNCEFDVYVKLEEASRHGDHPGVWVDFRNLTATDERIDPATLVH
jgi:hypothetical protein